MPRVRKVRLVKGKKEVRYTSEGPVIHQSTFCGECGQMTQAATIRRNPKKAKREGLKTVEEVARACMNNTKHKDGKNHLWSVGETMIRIY